jgi:GNAT superfamily N-acetyltransferase
MKVGAGMKYVPLSENHLHELCALWNREWKDSFPINERLLRQNSFQDKNLFIAGSWMAFDEKTNTLVGYIISKTWRDQVRDIQFDKDCGWIQVLVVEEAYRKSGIGFTLLRKAELAFQESGIQKVTLGNDFHYRFFPGVPHSLLDINPWFERQGYTEVEVVHDLWNTYESDPGVGLPEFEGVTFRLLEMHEGEQLIAFMKRCFPGRWEYQTIQYFLKGGTGREFVILVKEEQIIGFCRINDASSTILAQNIYWSALFEDELGGAGPLGIDENYRGKNYGLAIVQAGIYFLLQRGIRNIVIDSTPYVDFYGKLGYKVWRNYSRFEKKFDLPSKGE